MLSRLIFKKFCDEELFRYKFYNGDYYEKYKMNLLKNIKFI